MLICDFPAKSYVMAIKGHSGYFSCTKCCTEGFIVNGVVCFGDTKYVKRNDRDFRDKRQEEHHVGEIILEKLPEFDLIENVPLDYMHLILLGVIK